MHTRFVFYNSETGKIYSVRSYANHAQAEQNCQNQTGNFNMTCNTEAQIGVVSDVNCCKVNVSVIPHRVESTQRHVNPFCVEMRQRRNMRLSGSDWTQAPDSPLSAEKKAEWATYRQALRDMDCDSYSSFSEVIWPTIPN
jgi:hypothetical protein